MSAAHARRWRSARVAGAQVGELAWLRERKWLRITEPRVKAALQAVFEVVGVREVGSATGLVVAVPDVRWPDEGLAWADLPPLWLLTVLPNSAAGHISRAFGITGPVLTCAEFEEACRTAESWLADGVAHAVLVVELSRAGAEAWARCEGWECREEGGSG